MLQGFVLNLFAILPFAVIVVAVVRMFSEMNATSGSETSVSQISLLKQTPVMLGVGVIAAAVLGLAVAVVDGGVSAGAAITSLLA